jgi:hypothetical protein
MRVQLTSLAVAVAPLLLTPLLFVAVLRSGPVAAPLARRALPQETYDADHCTWYCHNHGCPHGPVLPSVLSGDDGLFGWTVDALHAGGDRVSPHATGIGYGVVNLAVFCAAWPGGMLALWIVALRQRRRIQAMRLEERP